MVEAPRQPDDMPAALSGSLRIVVLLFLAAAAFAPLLPGTLGGAPPAIGMLLRLAAMAGIAFVVGYLELRSVVLALAAALGPMPGASLALTRFSHAPVHQGVALVYALGFSIALFAGHRYVTRIAEGDAPRAAIGVVWRALAPMASSAAFIAVAMPLGVALAVRSLSPLYLAAANSAAIISAFVTVPLAGSFVPAGEDFIAATNRIAEAWTRRLDVAARAGRAPWMWSATGIFAVFAILACFGSAALATEARPHLARVFEVGGGIVLTGSVIAARDWRRGVAVLVAVLGAFLLGVWGFARSGVTADTVLLVSCAQLIVLCFVPIAAIASGAARAADGAAALEAGVLAAGAPVAAGFVASILLLAPWFGEAAGRSWGDALALVFAAAAALIFLPALSGVLESLLPRRRNLADRYRLK